MPARIGATENISLDGVMQGPGRPDEDTRGGFTEGGWANGYTDDVAMQFMAEGMSRSGGMLFGRWSYVELLKHWTSVTEPNPFTEHLLGAPKFVASRNPDAELAYPNSTLLVGEAADTVAKLKSEFDGDLSIIGSGELVRSLHAAGLMDEYTLQIFPITLGSGTRLFAESARSDLALGRSVVTTTGVIIAQYSVKH